MGVNLGFWPKTGFSGVILGFTFHCPSKLRFTHTPEKFPGFGGIGHRVYIYICIIMYIYIYIHIMHAIYSGYSGFSCRQLDNPQRCSQGIFGMPSMANGLDVQQLLVEVPIAPWEFQW